MGPVTLLIILAIVAFILGLAIAKWLLIVAVILLALGLVAGVRGGWGGRRRIRQ